VAWDKERYANDPVYRSKIKAVNSAWAKANRPRINARFRHRRATEPKVAEARRRAWLRKNYGITLEEFDAMVAHQDGLCALCARRPSDTLCVDHSHDTEMLRLLLCRTWNTGFGCFGDDPALMRAGADYLEIWQIIHARRLKAVSAKPIPKKKTSKPKKRKDMKCLLTLFPTKKPKPRD
jgi:hypothetical protein